MIVRRWNDIGLSGRTAILMVIPMVLAISVFGYFVTVDKIESSEKSIQQKSELLVRHFSSIVELGMVAQDEAVLVSYADIMLKEEGVVSVLMQDINNKVLLEKADAEWEKERGTIKYISAPVYLSGVTVGGIESESDGHGKFENGQSIGSVRVGVLSDTVHIKQEKILLIGLISTISGIILSILIGYRLSRAITVPILRLNETVDLLTAGRLSARAKEESIGEIGALEHGINNMAESLYGAQTELRQRVDKATNELNLTVSELEQRNIELEKSRRQAEKLGDEKAQFLARMSHELRTPLNAVIGFSRLIGKKVSEQERQEYAKTIINSATQLSSVIDDVLILSKLKSDSLSISQAQFNPGSACEDIVVMLSTGAKEKNIELVLLIDENVPDFVDGDVLRISQVLTNLISNAIKFTSTGDIIVSVAYQADASGDLLMMTVTDTGCGISLENIDKLFNEFSQVESSLTRQLAGVGLGLFISRRLARAMGGDITVTSKEGEGSCFSFSIPLLNPVYDEQSRTSDDQLSGKNVLLFEEHPKSRQSLKNMLQRFGMNVFPAENRDQAIDFLVADNGVNSPDILVLSFSAEQLKAVKCNDIANAFLDKFDGPALLLTGASTWDLPPGRPAHESQVCVSKPLRLETLHRVISSLLGIKGSSGHHQKEFDEYFVGPWLEGKSVLVVEDNRFNQELIRMMLEERSAQVTVAGNANDAISAASNQKFSLILMDLHMPESDGISVARILREEESACSDAPIVLVTADVLFDGKTHIDDGVINQILYKPIYENSLDKVLEICVPGYAHKKLNCDVPIPDNTGSSTVEQKITESLQKEILRLCGEINKCLELGRVEDAREYAHQLSGLAGYKQLNEINSAVIDLQALIKSNDIPPALLQLSKIKQSVI